MYTSLQERAVLGLFATVFVLALTPTTADAQKKERNLVTRAEIDSSPHIDRDLLTVLRSLRPHFLAPPRGVRSLGNGTKGPFVVSVGGTRTTGYDMLRATMANTVEEARYLDATQSENEFGANYNCGAIVIKLRDFTKDPSPSKPALADTTRKVPR